VAPFPEENVPRAVEAVGIEPIVFGSDFPHGEGLPDPSAYMGQIATFNEEQQKAIMRGNLARYLGLDA
jgi:predicted TIM-barrel fold metal-dependent hydrolase